MESQPNTSASSSVLATPPSPGPSPSPSPPKSTPSSASKQPKAPIVPLRLPHRVADYFLVVGGIRQDVDSSNTANAPVESSESLGSGANRAKPPVKLGWTARVLDRFPRTDHHDAEMPKDLEMFCFPSAYELSAICLTPEAHCFVLTEADGTRVYGCCLRFYEPLDETRLAALEHGLQHGFSDDDAASSSGRVSIAVGAGGADKRVHNSSHDYSGQLIYAPKAFVIVSHWPFFQTSNDFFRHCIRTFIFNPMVMLFQSSVYS
jgi:hypothetical protein